MGGGRKAAAVVALAVSFVSAMPGRPRAQQAPTPVPAPTPIATPRATPLATPSLFHCSCSTPGQPVVWAGLVAAPNFLQARQAAAGRCLGALGATPASPLIPLPQQAFAPSAPSPPAPMFNPCSACACN